MAKSVPVVMKGIKVKIPVVQGEPSATFKPNLNGLSIADLNEIIKTSKKVEIGAVFCPAGKKNPAWGAPLKVINFKGIIEVSDDFILKIEGDAKFSASSYAHGIIEEKGKADVYFINIVFPEQMLGLDPPGGMYSAKLGTILKTQ